MNKHLTIILVVCWGLNVFSQQKSKTPEQQVDSLKKALLNTKIDSSKAKLYTALGTRYVEIDMDSSLIYLDKGIRLSKLAGFTRNLPDNFVNKGMLYFFRKEYDSSMFYYQKAAKEAEKLKMYDVFFKARLNQGSVLMSLKKSDSAYRFYTNTLKQAKKYNNKKAMAFSNIVLGGIQLENKEHAKALDYFMNARDIALESNDKRGLARSYSSIGIVYFEIYEQYDKALENFKKALSSNRALGYNRDVAHNLASIAVIYNTQEKFKRANPVAEESVSIFRKINYEEQLAFALMVLANSELGLGKQGKAKEIYEEALALTAPQDTDLKQEIFTKLGILNLEIKKINQARKYFNEALKITDTKEFWKERDEILGLLADLELAQSNYREAQTHNHARLALKDSIAKNLVSEELATLQLKYERSEAALENSDLEIENKIQSLQIEKQKASNRLILAVLVSLTVLVLVLTLLFRIKRKTNFQLAQNNKVIAQQNSELISAQKNLEISLSEKEILLKEVHHRVKNNLQIISSLLSMQARESNKDGNINEFLFNSQNRLESIALIHETLYNSTNLADVDMQEYIDKLTSYAFESNASNEKQISRNLDISPIFLNVQRVIPVGLVLSELVTNTLKHAFPQETGEILISFKEVNEEYQLKVSDNGVGFEPTMKESLGFDLIKSLVHQLSGKLEVFTDKGANVLISFPKTEFVSLK